MELKHFKLVDSGIDTSQLLGEIQANWDLWDLDISRQKRITKQRETKAITLRSHAATAAEDSRFRAARPFRYEGVESDASKQLPAVSQWVDDLVSAQGGKVGRAVMTKLQPEGVIYPHTDDGLYWLLRDRFHLVVSSPSR